MQPSLELPFLYSLDIFKDLPGLTGLVISCVFSGSLRWDYVVFKNNVCSVP